MMCQFRTRLLCLIACIGLVLPIMSMRGQAVTQVGLRSVAGQGRFRGLRADSAGNLYTLLDAGDGVRVVKMDPAAAQILAETHVGQAGDQAAALALDPTGNVYVTGTSPATGSITGTTGAAFPSRADSTVNSFLIKLDGTLTPQWTTFLGSGRMAATGVGASAQQVVVTGAIYAATLPVTADGIQQQPLPGSGANGFVESFSTATGALGYSTYLSGANGDTQPTAVAVDAIGNAYIVGTTSATGFPTLNALVPQLQTDAASPISGFLTKLAPAGDGFVFSTYVPGSGLTAAAVDAGTGTLLASGSVSAGLFPLTQVRAPIAAGMAYQTALRIPLDGSAVSSATLLAPGTVSVIAPASSGFITGVSSESAYVPPLLPVAPIGGPGSAFLLGTDADGAVQHAAQVGGIPVSNGGFAGVPSFAGGVSAAGDGTALLAGGIAPTLSDALLGTERYDIALGTATSALPSAVRDALPDASCSGSACAGGAAVLQRFSPALSPSLLLSVDNVPNLVLRNAGSVQATGLQITANSFTEQDTCGTTLAAGAECDIALTGSGPGSIQVTAGNASNVSAALPANSVSANVLGISPKAIDFGITAAATPRTAALTLTNLSGTPQTFTSRAGITNSRFTVSEAASTCLPVGNGTQEIVPAGGSCVLTLRLAASSNAANDGPVRATWLAGPREIPLTGYTQAASLSVSSAHIGFGRVFSGGLRTARSLYLSNGSDLSQAHTPVMLSPSLPFTLTDGCPASLAPRSVCRMAISYASPLVPSSDAATISVDGIAVLIDGQTVASSSVTGASSNPNLSVAPASVVFSQPVVSTAVSTETQSVTVQNTGAVAFPLTLATTGDFTASACPASLAGGSSCVVTLHFNPTDAGTRQGLLSVTAGSSSPMYVSLSGTATAFLPVSGLIAFGESPLQTPALRWYKVSQPFASLTAAASGADFGVLLVEDTGYGYGSPGRTQFRQTVTGTCLNCYLGIQFLPSQTGAETATLSLSSTSGGGTQTLTLTGTGTAQTGPLLSPATQDFGAVSVGSSSGAVLFTLNNATSAGMNTGTPALTGSFVQSSAATGGTPCGGTLQGGESCTVAVQFSPTVTGAVAGTLSVNTSSGTVTAGLSGFGQATTGIALQPTALSFRNVPSAEATVQTVTVTNTGTLTATVGAPVSSDAHFQAATACGVLNVGASCTINVTYVPDTAPVAGTLSLPVTTSPGGSPQASTYTVPLNGLYTAANAGIQITPGEDAAVQFGAIGTGSLSNAQVLRVNNLSGKALTATVIAPRQFPVLGTTCSALAAGGSCSVTVAYAPLVNADATGTLMVQGVPTDGSAAVTGLAYLQGYGNGAGTLAVSGNFNPGGTIDFGQVPSGQSVTQTLTVSNQSPLLSITVRRIRSAFPFLATSNCGATLAPGGTCTITVRYAPNAAGVSGTQDDAGVVALESDAANGPLLVNLAGRAVPAVGSATATPLAALATSQGTLTFSGGTVGAATAPQTVTISNTGTVALTVQGVLTSPDFTATGNCGALPVGGSCTVAVAFTPQAAGVRSGALEIQSDAAVPLEFVSLTGNATPASVSLVPLALTYGQIVVGGTSTAQAATLTNTGSSAATVGAIGVMGDFAVVAGGAGACATGATLAAGAACTVNVVFTPSQTGTRTGTLSVATTATALPLTVSLSGTGAQPQLRATPSALDFGGVLVGNSAMLSITLTNVSASVVNGLKIGVSAGDFLVAATCGPVTLPAGSSCSLNVTFSPTQAGPRTGTLTIASSDPASPLTVSLRGNGLVGGSFTLTVNGSSSASTSVVAGTPATYALALTPVNGFTGAVALTCAPQAIAQYVTCSVSPSTVTLTNGTVPSTVTITTVSAVSASLLPMHGWRDAVLCALPFAVVAGVKRRKGLFLLGGLLALGGCGSGNHGDTRIRYAAAGTYQFTVAAASTTGVTASQSVPLTLTVRNP